MILHTQAYGRAGLIGNPSDGYHGKTISIILRNFAAEVTCYESPDLAIVPGERDQLRFASLDALGDDVELHGYYGGVRLIKAAIKTFRDYCRAEDIKLANRNFTISYRSSVPVRVGLAGSSAIITATIRALMLFFEVDIPIQILPNVILRVETEELGIGAGLQDRVIQVYEGMVFMDFERDFMAKKGYGQYEPLPVSLLPPLYIAYHDHLSEGTEITHNDLRSRYRKGDREVIEAMQTFAAFAQESRDLLLAGKGEQMGPLMDANFDLRTRILAISEGNRMLVEIGRRLGAHVKFSGSGGAVIGQYDGDPQCLKRLQEAYAQFGATCLTPML